MTYQPTSADFQALVQLSRAQHPPIDPTQVAVILFEESAGFNPAQQNFGGAPNYGLNQMSASNLSAIGLTPAQWTSMSAAQQLVYIFRFWASSAATANGGRFPSDGGELLAMNFEPGAFANVQAGSNPNAVLAASGGPYASNYAANKSLDPEGTGQITVNTCRQLVSNLLVNYAGNSRWQMIEAGIAAASGGGGLPPISPVPPPQPASSMLSNLALAIAGGLAIGGAAHVLLPRFEAPRRRRRYRYA